MNIHNVSKFLGDFKTIWVGISLLLAGAVWAGDTRWMKVKDVSKVAVQIELTNMQQRIEELEIQKIYEKDPDQLKMLEALINIKESKINVLTKKYSIGQ